MSLYEQLPVYKKALDLTVYFNTIVRHFDKHSKYTIGAELCNLSRKILILIARANAKQERQAKLQEAIELLEELKILIHVCKEIKAFRSSNSFEFATRKTIEVAKQCEGWLRSQNSSNVKP
jgi:hypothetical protein